MNSLLLPLRIGHLLLSTVAKVGRWLFLFGGTSIPFGETPTSALYRYDLNNPINDGHNSLKERSNRWHLIPVTGDVPEERYGHVSFLYLWFLFNHSMNRCIDLKENYVENFTLI